MLDDRQMYADGGRDVYTYDQSLLNYSQMTIPPPPNNSMNMDGTGDMETFNMDGVYTNMPLLPQYTLQHCPQPPDGPPPVVLMDKNIIDPYMAAEISSIVHTLSSSQLVYILAALKKFVKIAPSEARTFLIKNPQLAYALLHSQFILGEVDKSILNLSKIDSDIALINKFERSSDVDRGKYYTTENDRVVTANEDLSYYDSAPQFPPTNVPITPVVPAAPVHTPLQAGVPPLQQGVLPATVPMPQPGIQAIPTPPYGTTDDDPYRTAKDHWTTEQSSPTNQITIDDLLKQGVYPASVMLVEEVLKNNEILTNIQRATMKEMETWPAEQKQQVLAIKVALHLRGISVNL